ncbi:phage tail protein [Paenibacillus albicereus]|uniref:Phage tail protein n=1 Tax=Paenibacillus albicereus TaxID=2726185 RepID=A0A6H2GYJ9_9BACL|nr:tail fiber protein [Paenibacillus albicereus]QJC52511.1 phage tail protein [Paenibacillus albicereus]
MSEPYLGEIRLFSIPYAPKGWLPCNGQQLSIQQNQALFSLLGTIYGGDGVRTFALPNLQGRAPLHPDPAHRLDQGQTGGEEAHVLTPAEMPVHRHQAYGASTAATSSSPAGSVWAKPSANDYAAAATASMSPAALATAGQSSAHGNMQPYTVITFCIAVTGLYPSRN